MRQITKEIINVFYDKQSRTINNTRTDGKAIFLHGNKIVERRADNKIYITSAGWETNTTKERLNGLTGVSISQKKGIWYLNGTVWRGEWICISPES